MNFDALQAELNETAKYLTADTVITPREAEIRAATFLKALYDVAAATRSLDRDLFKLESYKSSIWAQVYLSDGNKTVDAKKASAEANPTFTAVQEQYSGIESDLNYLRNITRVFTDAHLFYRNQAKGDMKNVSF